MFGTVKKIISGGQTGVDQAALDTALKLDIPHGGWVPKGRMTEDGPLSAKYNLLEMPSASYAARTEMNIKKSDATLIISRGPLDGGSELTKELALKHERPWLHINLLETPAFKAATLISDWLSQQNIEILNVAGPRASKDPQIYGHTCKLVESVFYLGLMQNGAQGPHASGDTHNTDTDPPQTVPETVNQAVERLVANISLRDKTTIANMVAEELSSLEPTIGRYILDQFGLWLGNEALFESCRSSVDHNVRTEEDAASIIIEALWDKLRKTHKLRVLK